MNLSLCTKNRAIKYLFTNNLHSFKPKDSYKQSLFHILDNDYYQIICK